jgi:hypothetical protein
MPRVSQLTRPWVTPAQVEIQGEVVRFTYDRNALTSRLLADTVESDDVNRLADLLARVLIEWDVTADNGMDYPTDAASLAALPLGLLRIMLTEVSAFPTRAEGNDSPGQSSTEFSDSTGRRSTHQNGPGTSNLPEPSVSPSPS